MKAAPCSTNAGYKHDHWGHVADYRSLDRLAAITSERYSNNTVTLMGILHAAVRDGHDQILLDLQFVF